jgi:hypothetical protein
MMIKEAAKNLFDKNQITQEDFNFINEHSEEFEKIAINWNDIINAAKPIAAGIGTGAAATFTAEELYNKLSRHAAINKSYEQMQEKMPVLKEYPQEQIKDYFDVIKTFSPKSASNPLVAAALVHKMLEFGGVDHKLVQDIAHIESATPPTGFLYEIAKSTAGGMTQPPKEQYRRN